MVLIGVTKKRRIGVDIVKIESSYRFHDHAEYIFTPGEKACLQKIKPELRFQVFFRIWALKEAILKATGNTLAMMEKTDLSEIINDVLISPEYLMKFLGTHPPLFICQFNMAQDIMVQLQLMWAIKKNRDNSVSQDCVYSCAFYRVKNISRQLTDDMLHSDIESYGQTFNTSSNE